MTVHSGCRFHLVLSHMRGAVLKLLTSHSLLRLRPCISSVPQVLSWRRSYRISAPLDWLLAAASSLWSPLLQPCVIHTCTHAHTHAHAFLTFGQISMIWLPPQHVTRWHCVAGHRGGSDRVGFSTRSQKTPKAAISDSELRELWHIPFGRGCMHNTRIPKNHF